MTPQQRIAACLRARSIEATPDQVGEWILKIQNRRFKKNKEFCPAVFIAEEIECEHPGITMHLHLHFGSNS